MTAAFLPARICTAAGESLVARASPHLDEHHLQDLFARLRAGDAQAPDELLDVVYGQLKAMARRHLGNPTDSLNATSLVHEVYLKLFRDGRGDWAHRAHFLATAARAMRQVIVDRARHRQAKKRSGPRVPLDDLIDGHETRGADLVALDDAVRRLGERDPELVQVIEMRFFAGYSIADTARILNRSPRTIVRAWEVARAWLEKELTGG